MWQKLLWQEKQTLDMIFGGEVWKRLNMHFLIHFILKS